MNKYLIIVVAVLALTGCNKAEEEAKKKAEEVLQRCYADAEATAEYEIDAWNRRNRENSSFWYMAEGSGWLERKIKEVRETYGVSSQGYINQAGIVRCERLIDLGEFR